MIQMTMQVSDELAQQCHRVGAWLPSIVELSFFCFKSRAAATASEVIEFLSGNPEPKNVLEFHVSENAQQRLRRLLALNEAGCISKDELIELDELQRIEHFMIMLKTQVAIQLRKIH